MALATPFVIPLLRGQKTLVGALTVCAALIAASASMQAADAQQFQRPLPNDLEQFRMIEECVEMTFGRPAGKEQCCTKPALTSSTCLAPGFRCALLN